MDTEKLDAEELGATRLDTQNLLPDDLLPDDVGPEDFIPGDVGAEDPVREPPAADNLGTVAERQGRANAIYDEGKFVVGVILAKCDLTRQQFYDGRHKAGLPLLGHRRRIRPGSMAKGRVVPTSTAPPPSPDKEPEQEPTPLPTLPTLLPPWDDGPADRSSLGDRMARLVAHNMTVLEDSLTAAQGVDPERIGRALTAQARMVAGLDKLNKGREDDTVAASADRQPRSVAELRDELRRHLQRIQDEGRAGGLPDDAVADGYGASAGALADPMPPGSAPAE